MERPHACPVLGLRAVRTRIAERDTLVELQEIPPVYNLRMERRGVPNRFVRLHPIASGEIRRTLLQRVIQGLAIAAMNHQLPETAAVPVDHRSVCILDGER